MRQRQAIQSTIPSAKQDATSTLEYPSALITNSGHLSQSECKFQSCWLTSGGKIKAVFYKEVDMAEETTIRTIEVVQQELATAATKKDWKLLSKLAAELHKLEVAQEEAEKAVKLDALTKIGEKIKLAIGKVIQPFVDRKELDAADGVWYSWDFGAEALNAHNIRLVKDAGKPTKASGTGSYISRPEKTADLLAQVGSHIMFKEATKVTIDKAEKTMAAGTTFLAAYKASDNGGWRNRVRMALLKEAGLI